MDLLLGDARYADKQEFVHRSIMSGGGQESISFGAQIRNFGVFICEYGNLGVVGKESAHKCLNHDIGIKFNLYNYRTEDTDTVGELVRVRR